MIRTWILLLGGASIWTALGQVTPSLSFREVTTFAGSGAASYLDGTGTAAAFNTPKGLAIDNAGNLYVADGFNYRIRKITPAGVVTTLAGGYGSADGTGTGASFKALGQLAWDSVNNVLYVADILNYKIRKITLPGAVVTTLAGSGTSGFSEGTGTGASFSYPVGIAWDASTGNIYVGDKDDGTATGTIHSRIWQVTPGGVVTTLAGSGTRGIVEGTGTAAQFWYPDALVSDGSGNLYARSANSIMKVTTSGGVATLFASSGFGEVDAATPLTSKFITPYGFARDSAGYLYVSESQGYKIRCISPTGVVSTVAGTGSSGFADGIGMNASFKLPFQMAVDSTGNVYVADSGNHRIRKIAIANTTVGYSPTNTLNKPVSSTYTGGSYGAISYTSSNASVGTVSASGVVTIVELGATTITATQAEVTGVNTAATTSYVLTVVKGTPTITWATPLAISQNRALTATQLNATADVAGTFAYTPALGTIMSTLGNQTLSVTFTPTDTTHYNSTTATVTLVVNNKTTPTISTAPTASSITYGQTLASSSLSGGVASVGGSFAFTSPSTAPGGGTATQSVTFTPTDTTNYNTANLSVSVNVNPASQTITFGSLASKTYGDAPFSVSATATSGLAPAFSIVSGPATISGSTITVTGAGTVVVRASQAGNSNYAVAAAVDQSFTAAKKTLTVTADAKSRLYGAANPAFTASITGFVNSETSAVISGVVALSTPASSTSPVGSYAITAAVGTLSAANYDFSFTPATLTVTQAPLTVTADAKSRLYGAADPTFTATITGFVNSETTALISGAASFSTTATSSSGVGTYPITPALGTLAASNYAFTTFSNGTLTVSQVSQTITFGSLPSKTYGDAPFSVSASATSGLSPSFSIVSGPATISGSTVTLTGVGTVVVRASQAGNANYAAAAVVDQSFIVAKKTLTVTADAKSRLYGAADPTFTATITGFVNSETTAIISGAPSISTTATSTSEVGTYPITPALGTLTASNYTFATFTNGILTVTQASQTITFGSLASKTYGDASFSVSSSASSGLSPNISIVSGPATISGNTVTLTGAGTVVVRASQAGNTNYAAAADVDQSFTVAKKTLTVTADAKSRAFGAANPAFTASITGFVNSETSAVISGVVALSTPASPTSPVGSYVITAAVGTLSAANYDFSFALGTLTVGQASQTITLGTLTNKVYGDAPFNVSATTSSGLSPSFSIERGPATISGSTVTLTGAGTVVVCASQAGDANYAAAADVDQSFIVAKATPTLTWATPSAITYGTALSAKQLNASANVAGSVVYTPAIDMTPSAGPKTLTATFTPTDAANYNTVSATVSLVVAQATPTLTWVSPSEIPFGTALSATQLNATSNVPGTFLYNPAAGTVPAIGLTTLKCSFTPTDTINYRSAEFTTELSVVKPNPGAPTSVLVSAIPGGALVSFTAPTYTGVSLISGYTILATASDGSTVAFTAKGSPIKITGLTLGKSYRFTVTAINSSGPGDSSTATEPVMISRLEQTIRFDGLADRLSNSGTFTLNAVASSGLPVTFTVLSGPAQLQGNLVTLTGENGIVKLVASQAGDATYAAAPDVVQAFTVTAFIKPLPGAPTGVKVSVNEDLLEATVTFTAPSAAGSTPITAYLIRATASDGSSFTLTTTESPVKITGLARGKAYVFTVTAINNAGPGDSSDFSDVISIKLLEQTIRFTPLADCSTNSGSFALKARASSGLPVSFAVLSGPALLQGNIIDLTGASGVVRVRASQSGDATYAAAPDVDLAFTVSQGATQVIFSKVINPATNATEANLALVLPVNTRRGTLLIVSDLNPNLNGIAEIQLGSSGSFTNAISPLNAAIAVDPLSASLQAALLTLTINGALLDYTFSGTVAGLGFVFQSEVLASATSTNPSVGFYRLAGLVENPGLAYTVIGPSGDVLLIAQAGAVVTGGLTTLKADRSFSFNAYPFAGKVAIQGGFQVGTNALTATLKLPNTTSYDYAGLSIGTKRTDRLINLSSRAKVGTGESILIAGFVVSGADPKKVLIRAVGPALGAFGLADTLPNPAIKIYQGERLIAENDDWNRTDAAEMARVGAFALTSVPSESRSATEAFGKDAALITTLDPGAYTAQIADPSGTGTGVALAEIYDASINPNADYQRLVNISSRGLVTPDDGVLIGGFVVTGNYPKTLLIRGVGPGLSNFGVTGVLPDPSLTIYQDRKAIATNEGWANSAAIATAASQTGAFALPSGSKDAAVLITLAPGAYTAQIKSAKNVSSGVALIEIYEVP